MGRDDDIPGEKRPWPVILMFRPQPPPHRSRAGTAGLAYSDGREWTVDSADDDRDITVSIHGMQYADGRVVSRVAVGGLRPDWPISSQRARRLARVLMAAAESADSSEDMQPYM